MSRDIFDDVSDDGDIFDKVSGPTITSEKPITRTALSYPSASAMSADYPAINKDQREGPVSISYPKEFTIGAAQSNDPVTHIVKADIDPREEIKAGRLNPGDVFYQQGIGKFKIGGPTVITRNMGADEPSPTPPKREPYTAADALYLAGQGTEKIIDFLASKLKSVYNGNHVPDDVSSPTALQDSSRFRPLGMSGIDGSFRIGTDQPPQYPGNIVLPSQGSGNGSLPLYQGNRVINRDRK